MPRGQCRERQRDRETAHRWMTALYDSHSDSSHRERLAMERAVAPKVRQKAAGANGAGFCRVRREGRRPLGGDRSEEAPESRLRSRPPLSLHSPEARAGSPSAEAPRGRRLQRRGRRRIMRQRSWPGRVDPDPLGSLRLGPARQVCGRQPTSRSGSPTRSWNSQAERPRNWTRRGQDAAPASFRPRRPGLPGGGS